MKKITDIPGLRFVCLLAVAVLLVPAAHAGLYQHGTVVRMRMGGCLPEQHTFMMAMSGAGAQNAPEVCPEYTLVSDKVVYIIVGRSSNQLVPLADEIDFRLQNAQLAVRVDDAKRESKFAIKEMILRSEWDLLQKHIAEQLSNPTRGVEDGMVWRSSR
ncbi:MAG TPA: hypothetical protein VFA67_12245 [Candidatus Sulfotelmatobacter sp.]|nr:hypothetical protein [Candidatus Sulfotelmatobacter sp.]